MQETTRALAGRALIAGFSGHGAEPRLLEAAREGALGGVILFRRNIEGPEQVARLLEVFTSAAPVTRPLFTCVDQEGGRVARLGPPLLSLPPMRVLGEIDDPTLTEQAGLLLGAQLSALGFNVNFAPVLDVDTNPDNPVIGDRAFGRDPERVGRHGAAFARGLLASGVLPCGKHFPGHGDTDLDSHLALPRLAHPMSRLEEVELAPFRATRDAMPLLMSAHVVFDALDPALPATLSRRVMHGLLRETLGYPGVVVSDDLEMKAVSERYGVEGSSLRALRAGCDLLLVCSDVDALFRAREAIAREAERDEAFHARLTDAVARADALRALHPPAPRPSALTALLDDPRARALEEDLQRRSTKAP